MSTKSPYPTQDHQTQPRYITILFAFYEGWSTSDKPYRSPDTGFKKKNSLGLGSSLHPRQLLWKSMGFRLGFKQVSVGFGFDTCQTRLSQCSPLWPFDLLKKYWVSGWVSQTGERRFWFWTGSNSSYSVFTTLTFWPSNSLNYMYKETKSHR